MNPSILFSQFAFLELPAFFEKHFSWLEEALIQSGIQLTQKIYLSACLSLSLFASLFSAIALAFFSGDYLLSLFAFFLFFPSFFVFLSFLPIYLKKKRAERIEAELSIGLKWAGVGPTTSFDSILSSLSSCGELGKEFQKTILQIKTGSSVRTALLSLSKRVDSIAVKRLVSQLLSLYEGGNSSNGLKKLGDELISIRAGKAREYGAKLGFYGLVFIAVSCIIPALFGAYLLVGSRFMELSFSENQILLLFSMGFPFLDLLILFFLWERKPYAV